jgi:hypothetical protein
MKIIKVVFVVILLAFAALQWNDSDPLLWMIIYGYAAAIIILDIAGKDVRRVYLFTIIAYALFSLIYIPGVIDFIRQEQAGAIAQSMKAETPWIEETREFLGLIIVVGILLLLYQTFALPGKEENVEGSVGFKQAQRGFNPLRNLPTANCLFCHLFLPHCSLTHCSLFHCSLIISPPIRIRPSSLSPKNNTM